MPVLNEERTNESNNDTNTYAQKKRHANFRHLDKYKIQ
jgi:hypothetical protein